MSLEAKLDSGLVVRQFHQRESSLEFEISEAAARQALCASVIKQGVPVKLFNNMPQIRKYNCNWGLLYDPDSIKVIRAFKKDVYSDRFDKEKFSEETIKGKKKVPIPDSHTGTIVLHRDYETVTKLSEKVSRMYAKQKGPIFHSELIMKASEPTKPLQRIIALFLDNTLLSDLSNLSRLVNLAIKHLPGLPFVIYDDTTGNCEIIKAGPLLQKITPSLSKL